MPNDDATVRDQLRTEVCGSLAELRSLARRLAREDADDAVQDTALAALSQPLAPTSVPAWLRQVLRNGIRGRFRHRRAWDDRRFDPPAPEIPETPEQRATTIEMFALVRAALDDLEEPYRRTIQRRFFEGLSPADIARADGEPSTTVRWRVHEGLRRMRARLDDRCGGRERWYGALVLAFDPVTPTTEGATRMTTTSLTVSLLTASTLALAAGVTVAMQSRAAADDPAAAAVASASDRLGPPPRPDSLASDGHDPAASCEPEVPTLEPADDRRPMQYFVDTVVDCFDAAPEGSLAGVMRLELDMRMTRASIDEPFAIEHVHATHGRKLLCADGAPEPMPVDADGVVRHREIEACIASSLDLERLPTFDDGLSGGILELPLGLDGHGGLAPSPEAPAWQLPALADEPVPDPSAAIDALALPVRGATGTDRIEIVACGGYSCTFSRKGDAHLEELRARVPQLAVAWLQYPLEMHVDALLTSTAAVAASRQGKFWEMHRALFEHAKPMDRDDAIALATTLGLDVQRFTADLDDPATAVEVARQRQVCEAAGARATPSFFVQGDMVTGAIGTDGLAHTLEELAALEE